tara:strand:+ start:36 stop:560 length:525 start_codon:yes stop_codon:yes gene_type:complete
MTVRAKTLIKDKFWIVEENGQKLGTLQKKDDNGWIFLTKADKRQVYHTPESLQEKFGIDIFSTEHQVETADDVSDSGNTDYHVYNFPCSQKPYNEMWDVQKQLPIYTKTPKSKSLFCAGYYIICFEKGWRKAYCPKVITLQRYPFKGPIKSKLEMQQVLNNAIKEFSENSNPSN